MYVLDGNVTNNLLLIGDAFYFILFQRNSQPLSDVSFPTSFYFLNNKIIVFNICISVRLELAWKKNFYGIKISNEKRFETPYLNSI